MGASGGGIVAGSGGGGLTARARWTGVSRPGGSAPQPRQAVAVADTEFAIHAHPDTHPPPAAASPRETLAGLGADHTISGAVAGYVLKATASNAARMAATDGASGLRTASRTSWDVAALTAANTVGLRTPSSDVRAGAAEALLKSNAGGKLGLKGLEIGAAMILAGGGNIATEPDIQFTGRHAAGGRSCSLYLALGTHNVPVPSKQHLSSATTPRLRP